MKTKTHITNVSDATQQVTVTLDARISEQAQVFQNIAMENVIDMEEPISRESPYLTFVAVESACMSGAFLARRKMGVKGVAVDLIFCSATGTVENAEPFAVATMIGICEALADSCRFNEDEMCGWHLVSVERQF